MKKASKVIIASMLIVSAVALTGCSTSSGHFNPSTQTHVQLSEANFSVIKSVTGEASASYFLGIGPSKQDVAAQAKKDMLNKANLTGAQAIVNVTRDTKYTGYLIGRKKTIYVSAEVVEFK